MSLFSDFKRSSAFWQTLNQIILMTPGTKRAFHSLKKLLTVNMNPLPLFPFKFQRFFFINAVARWQKVNARIVTTKERKYADPLRTGSPVPGVELFDTIEGKVLSINHRTHFTMPIRNFPFFLGKEINIGDLLVREGYAIEQISVAIGSDQVLRLNNGSDVNGGPTSPPISNIVQLTNIINKNNGHHTINTPSTNGISNRSTDPNLQSTQPNSSRNTIPTIEQRNKTNTDKFTAICENTSNENYENTKIDQSPQLIGQFIAHESEQQNGLNANTSSDSSSLIKNGHFDGNLNDLTTSRPEQTA